MSSNDLLKRVADVLSPVLPAGGSILLGLSGGVDSVVLLHLLHQLSLQYSWQLSALHVHHGISPHADAWAAMCSQLCIQKNIPLKIEYVDIAPLRKLGVEAAARKLRHKVLSDQVVDVVALAHHLDDQVETLLLQLLRGAGVRGASAMPTVRNRTNFPLLVRPLLDVTRLKLIEYAHQHSLQWVEDESNADNSYPRNFLRHNVLPLLGQRFPAYRETLARSARHFSEATEMLDELAQLDAISAIADDVLSIEEIRGISAARGKNLLRYFLAKRGSPIPDSATLEEMLRQLCQARSDAAVCIAFGGWEIRRYRGHAYVLPKLSEAGVEITSQWHGETVLDFPGLNSALTFQPCLGQGLSMDKLRSSPVTIHARRGGEMIQLGAERPRRSLKNLFQEHSIPPWQRDRLPLLFCNDELICVPGVVSAYAYLAKSGEQGVLVNWRTLARD